MAEYVTAVIGGQLFGLPISRVQDVFMPERQTRVPLSPAEIAGVLNLRGRIVTVVDMRARLGLPKNDDGKPPMAVGVDLRGARVRAQCAGDQHLDRRAVAAVAPLTRARPLPPDRKSVV